MDLIENGEETRIQLQQFDHAMAIATTIAEPLAVIVRMVDVTGLDACALAYIFARHDQLRRLPNVHLSGRYPRHRAARQALADAGFDQYFFGRGLRTKRRPSVKLKVGSATGSFDPEEWLALHLFLKAQPGIIEQDRDAMYHAFGECVENVKQHAYDEDDEGYWYALAIKPTGLRPARAVVMDLGVGIPNTIRRTFVEEFRRRRAEMLAIWIAFIQEVFGVSDNDTALESVKRLAYDDWYCLYLASQGLRTETDQQKRGTGLNWLRFVVCQTQRGALHLLSGRSAVTWQGNQEPQATHLTELQGTIVCLEIGSPKGHR